MFFKNISFSDSTNTSQEKSEYSSISICSENSDNISISNCPSTNLNNNIANSHESKCIRDKNIENSKPEISIQKTSSICCRICHSHHNKDDQLISPCRCKGSLAHVHRKCVEQWLTRANLHQCELCLYNFPLEKSLRFRELIFFIHFDLFVNFSWFLDMDFLNPSTVGSDIQLIVNV